MHVEALLFYFLTLLTFSGSNAQNVQCVTVADGCDRGSSEESGVTSAISRFEDGQIYGGSDPIVMSSAVNGDALAMITYLCNDGSAPPKLEGSVIRSSLQKVLSCPNRCGGVASPNNGNCGFGVLIASNSATTDCFSKAVNVVPKGSSPQIVPSVSFFGNPVCLMDSAGARVLTGGTNQDQSSTGMTVEKCIRQAAADGWRYAGVEFGGECYWGDTETNPQQSNQGDCNTPCAGDPSEICGGGNRILVYENSNLQDVANAKISVDNYNSDPSNTALAQTAKTAVDNALNHALSFLDQIVNPLVKAAQEQLIQDLTAASATAATAVTAASVAVAAVLADQIAKAVASEQAVQDAKNQQPSQPVSAPPASITKPSTSAPSRSSTSSSTSSSSSACPLCVSCADDQNPETGPEDSTTVPERRSKFSKRANSKKETVVCGTTYQSGPYVAGNGGNRFPAFGYQYTVNTQSACVWDFRLLTWDPTQGGAPAATKGGSYETEHVYEAQLVRQFAEHIGTLDTGSACRQAGLTKNILARTSNFPGRRSNPFSARGGSALGQMMLNLPDNNSGAGNGAELVALDKELNILKAAVFNGATTSFSTANVAPGKLAKVTRFAMLYAYLSTPEVAAIFKATSQRMRTTLRTLDQEIAASSMANPGIVFETVYSTWEDNFLFQQGALVETVMDGLVTAAITQLRTDTSLGSQTLRNSFVTQVQAKTASLAVADPSKWFDLDELFAP
ncbi:WSC-domain-containing protein [Coleophoma cylindrospora]|uniref:WSC-domain-containing protein n=1 Tax=Coleophoma cylindrospora TaxID=1849047 RepID=A0A3D8RG01_9HELO|nr:WSC-domain-containing protein [Coleophoma cylindrospora]